MGSLGLVGWVTVWSMSAPALAALGPGPVDSADTGADTGVPPDTDTDIDTGAATDTGTFPTVDTGGFCDECGGAGELSGEPGGSPCSDGCSSVGGPWSVGGIAALGLLALGRRRQ